MATDPLFGGTEESTEEDLGSTPAPAWPKNLKNQLVSDLKAVFKELGLGSAYSATNLVETVMPEIETLVHETLNLPPTYQPTPGTALAEGALAHEFGVQPDELLDPSTFKAMTQIGYSVLMREMPAIAGGLGQPPGKARTGTTTRKLSAADFDIDALAQDATRMWRGLLLEEPRNPRDLARAYVDRRLSNPLQALDYESFVRNHLKTQPRWGTLYGIKPEGMTEEQYIAPYLSQAQATLGGGFGKKGAVTGTAALGAGLGASGQSFQALLSRQDAVTGSTPFINKLGQRMQELKGILRG